MTRLGIRAARLLFAACLLAALAPGESVRASAIDAQAPAASPVQDHAPQAPAVSSPKARMRTETVTYDHWTVVCRSPLDKSSGKSCFALLRLGKKGDKQPLLVWRIGRSSKGAPVVALRTPLGVRLKRGVQITLDAGAPRRLDFFTCRANGCEALAPLDDAFARALVTSPEATVLFTLVSGRTMKLKVALKGIAEALPAVRD